MAIGFTTVDILVSPTNPGAVGMWVGPVEAGGAVDALADIAHQLVPANLAGVGVGRRPA